jgi:hypothetical protein
VFSNGIQCTVFQYIVIALMLGCMLPNWCGDTE